jgi:predicted MFS family arabinose efflux permease
MGEQAGRVKVLSSGIASLLLSVGVARFAYTPLLPLMQEQAGLGESAAGWLAAVNYAGYLTGAGVATVISDLVLKDKLYRIGMVVALVTTPMMALSTDEVLWGVSRFFAGLGSAAGMLLGTGLILNWLIRHDHRSELGIHFAGIGLGIAGCAAVVEVLHQSWDWREQWYAFTAIGLLLLVPALRWFPRPARDTHTRSGRRMVERPPSPWYLRLFIAAYFCAGFGYVIGATFMVAIVEDLPGLAGRGNLAFLAIGLGAAPASIYWDLIARRVGDLNALVLAAGLQVLGIALPVLVDGLAATVVGALVFGSTVVGMVSLVLTMAGRFYPTRPATMMGKMTLSYGVAQIVGPATTAWLAARYGGYVLGLHLAAAVMLLGTVLLLLLKVVERRDAEKPTTDPERALP